MPLLTDQATHPISKGEPIHFCRLYLGYCCLGHKAHDLTWGWECRAPLVNQELHLSVPLLLSPWQMDAESIFITADILHRSTVELPLHSSMTPRYVNSFDWGPGSQIWRCYFHSNHFTLWSTPARVEDHSLVKSTQPDHLQKTKTLDEVTKIDTHNSSPASRFCLYE